MRYEDTEITSLGDFIGKLKDQCPVDQPTWFRGQENSDWKLKPSLARNGGITHEMPLITRFKQNAMMHMETQPQNEWEWMFVMQHHGLPTRLLDWTESPLVGLYFAVADMSPSAKDKSGALWAILPICLNKNSKLNQDNIPGFGDENHLDAYLPSRVAKHTVSYDPLAAIALRNTKRMQMQQGVFTVNHINLDALDNKGGGDYIWRYIIPKKSKAVIRKELEIFGVTKLTIFPELPSIAEHARSIVR